MATVMVVDDEERVRTLLAKSLASQGHSVVTAASASAAIERLESREVDLVVLDLVMPGLGGLAVLDAVNKRRQQTPVIVLSGVTDVGTRVAALDRGAVDVVSKPFSLTELLARVRRNIGTERRPTDDRYLDAGGIRLDVGRRRATFRSTSASLTEREFSLLAHLMRRAGEVCRKEELLHDVWHLDFVAMSRDVGATPLFGGADTIQLASTGDTSSFGVGEWATAFATATNPDAFDGDPVQLTGFVTPGPDGGFDLTRLVITHCVIDAQPASLPIVAASDMPDTGQWVTITGTVRSSSDGRLVVDAAKVDEIAEPEDPYEY